MNNNNVTKRFSKRVGKKLGKIVFGTFSSFSLLMTAFTVPALAEVKENLNTADVAPLENIAQQGFDSLHAVLDSISASAKVLFSAQEEPGESVAETLPADTRANSVSDLDGVTWTEGDAVCTLGPTSSGDPVDGQALKAEIASHKNSIRLFKTANGAKLTGSLEYLFVDCTSLETADFSQLVSSSITNTGAMFFNCSQLTFLDLTSLNTENDTSTEYMFYGCSQLTHLDLSSFKTANVDQMELMFCGCSKIESLDLSNFNTAKVTGMDSMFQDCSKLTSLNLSSFNSSALETCRGMFANCDSLEDLNLGSLIVPTGDDCVVMFGELGPADETTGDIPILGSIANIKQITMDGACVLEPGEGDSVDTGSGTFFDYKEPESWYAYYHGDSGNTSLNSANTSISAEPDAILTGFDEFKAYQGSHPGATTYYFGQAPTPPGPTPEPTPDSAPASGTDVDTLPITGDALSILYAIALVSIAGAFLVLAFYKRTSLKG